MAAAMMVEELRPVIGGVDTHEDFHVAAAVDSLGGDPRTASFPNNAAGHAALLAWLSSHGPLQVVGVEGTGSYGAGLSRHLRAAGSWCWRSTGRTGRLGGVAGSPTRSTRSQPREPRWLASRLVSPKQATGS